MAWQVYTAAGELRSSVSPSPIITSFANATHDHTNAAGGGTLPGTAIASGTVAATYLGLMTGDAGSGGAKGAAPAPAAGDAIKALYGDATYKLPGQYILTARTAISGASATISIPSQAFNTLLVILELRSASAVTIDTARLRFGDGTLDSTASNYYGYRAVHIGTTPTQTIVENLGAAAYVNLVAVGATGTSNHTSYALCYIQNYSTASRLKYVKIVNQYMYGTSTGNHAEESSVAMWLNTSKQLTQIEVSCGGGNIATPSAYTLIGLGGAP